MKQATLCFVIEGSMLLLGFKKKGFGQGKLNGFGGKIEPGESPVQAASRELLEESSINAAPESLVFAGSLTFLFPHQPSMPEMRVHVFVCTKWKGTPVETEEMKPRWVDSRSMPFGEMWDDDKYWLPKVLDGDRVEGTFTFGEDNSTIQSYKVNLVGRWMDSC